MATYMTTTSDLHSTWVPNTPLSACGATLEDPAHRITSGPHRKDDRMLLGCVKEAYLKDIWAWRAWRLPGRWTDGGRWSTVARWTRRPAARAYAPIPDLTTFPMSMSRSPHCVDLKDEFDIQKMYPFFRKWCTIRFRKFPTRKFFEQIRLWRICKTLSLIAVPLRYAIFCWFYG